jgi:hypothetical protein
MSTLTYGTIGNLVTGHQANIGDVNACFVDVAVWSQGNIDATNLATSAKPVTLLAPYRKLHDITVVYTDALTAGTYAFGGGGTLASGVSNTVIRDAFPIVAADHSVTLLTAKLRLRASVLSNATAAAITFTFGLYPVTVAGGADTLQFTLGTVVAGSTAAIASPTASTATTATGSDFSLPADGTYALGVVTSGTVGANSYGSLYCEIDVHHV